MEKVLTIIDRLRESDEATRRRALFGIVAGAVLLLGVLWTFSFRAQLSTQTADSSVVESELPSVGELFRRSGSSLFGTLKSGAKNLILGETRTPAAGQAETGVESSSAQDASGERAQYHRLPKSE